MSQKLYQLILSLSRRIKNSKKWIDFISVDKENTRSFSNTANHLFVSEKKKCSLETKTEFSSPKQIYNKIDLIEDEIKTSSLTDRNKFEDCQNPYLNFWNKIRKDKIYQDDKLMQGNLFVSDNDRTLENQEKIKIKKDKQKTKEVELSKKYAFLMLNPTYFCFKLSFIEKRKFIQQKRRCLKNGKYYISTLLSYTHLTTT